MRRPGSRLSIVAAMVCALALAVVGEVSAADSKLRVIVIVPFDTTALEREEQWMGEGVAQILALGLAQQPSIVQIERSRLKTAARVDAWNETTLTQAARAVRADAGLFGRIERPLTSRHRAAGSSVAAPTWQSCPSCSRSSRADRT